MSSNQKIEETIEQSQQIKSILNKVGKNMEFEIMFGNYNQKNQIQIIKFMRLLNYMKENKGLTKETSLDISYSQETGLNQRITIKNIKTINKILNLSHQRKNHVIFTILISQFGDDPDFEFMTKTKEQKNIFDLEQYDLRFRLSTETKLDFSRDNIKSKKADIKIYEELTNLPHTEADKIIFRYKQRVSQNIYESAELGTIRLDLTIVKSNNVPDLIGNSPKKFEVELEYIPPKSDVKQVDKLMKIIANKILEIKRILENSAEIISRNEAESVVSQYKKLLYGSMTDSSTNLYSMQPISAEVQHIVDKIPNKYAVSDKTDGEKHQLFILGSTVYMLSTNLVPIKTAYTIKDYDMSIFEGELVYIKKLNKYIFMIWGVLILKGKDIKQEPLLSIRLGHVMDFIKAIGSTPYEIKPFMDTSKKFDLIEQEKYYINQVEKFYDNLNKLLDKAKPLDIVFHNNIFLFPTGADNSEVYSFSDVIWSSCTSNPKVKCPYMLDGIIYTGLEQKYTKDKKEHKYSVYKYKPPHTNSIDVYMTFQRNIETGGYLETYDKSIGAFGSDSVFRVVNFFVGDIVASKEVPVPFMKNINNHEAFFALDRGQVRDIEGELVNNNSVIEVIYNNDPNIPHQYRWKILRTRWDKTESVLRDGKKYGNFKDYAEKIWKSMIEAVTINELKKMARPDTLQQQKEILGKRIDGSVISSERAQDIYYQKIANLGKVFRDYHNWIKSVLIYTYCGKYKEDGKEKKKNVFVFGIETGIDLMKYYHARVDKCICTDPDSENLFGSINSATLKYRDNSKKFPDFPKMEFIQYDGSAELNPDAQEKRLMNMSTENKKLIEKIKGPFDIFSLLFSIDNMFQNKLSVEAFSNTIKKYLKSDGYIICSLFDPSQVMKLMGNNKKYTSYYTDDDGQRMIFFEIVKKFDGDVTDDVGISVDVHEGWKDQEGKYNQKYLVTPKLLIKTMEKNNCHLVDTDLFINTYHMNREWFEVVIDHEENPKNKKFYKDVSRFYGDLKGADKESRLWNDLFRYYVFKKID